MNPIWQLWRTGRKSILIDAVPFSSGVHTIEGISERSFGEIWDNRIAIFGDTLLAYTNVNSIELNGIDKFINWGDIANFERTDAFSISIWFKITDPFVTHLLTV